MVTDNRKQRREEQQILLREKKRSELLNKKRITATEVDETTISNFKKKKEMLYSKDPKEVAEGIVRFRKALSIEHSPPIQPIIDAGLVPRFVELLSSSNILYSHADEKTAKQIRTEAAWALTNIASGNTEQTQTILDYGAIPLFADMLRENDEDIVDQAAWAFGNISGDSEKMRDASINCDALKIIICLIKVLVSNNKSLKILRNATWLISNLNRGLNPPPKIENVQNSLEVLKDLIIYNDEDVRNDALWAISYIANNEKEISGKLFEGNFIENLFDNLKNFNNFSTLKIIHPTIRTIANLVGASDDFIDKLIEMGLIPIFEDIFENYNQNKSDKLKKEICWIFSTIAHGTESHVSALLLANIPNLLYETSGMSTYIKSEACDALCYLTQYCEKNYDHFEICLSGQYFRFLNDCLQSFDNMRELRLNILITVDRCIRASKHWEELNSGVNKIVETKKVNKIGKFKETIEYLRYEDEDPVVEDYIEKIYAFLVGEMKTSHNIYGRE